MVFSAAWWEDLMWDYWQKTTQRYSWSWSSCVVSLQVRRKREARCKTSRSRWQRQKL